MSLTWNLPAQPLGRFTLWSELSVSARSAATQLGYREDQWNTPGWYSSLEEISWSDLSDEHRDLVELAMGIADEEVWDCWIAHFEDYFWHELQEDGLVQFYETLGWTKNSWEGSGGPPETDNTEWIDLTPDEQLAARSLCFDQNLWDAMNLEDYVFATPAPTISPTQGPTQDPSSSPSSAQTRGWSPTISPTLRHIPDDPSAAPKSTAASPAPSPVHNNTGNGTRLTDVPDPSAGSTTFQELKVPILVAVVAFALLCCVGSWYAKCRRASDEENGEEPYEQTDDSDGEDFHRSSASWHRHYKKTKPKS